MDINRSIRNLVYNNILMDEQCKFSFIENQVSIFDLGKAEHSRETASCNCFHQYLQNESQYIDLAYFSSDWRGSNRDDAICMNIWLTKIGNIVCEKPAFVSIEYRDGNLSLLHEPMLKLELLKGNKSMEAEKRLESEICEFKKEMLVENREALIELAHFGIDGNYNKEPRLNTVSQEFIVSIDNRGLTLSLASDVLNSANKKFYLTHYYRWHSSNTILSMMSHNHIEQSKLGPWSLETNILGMRRLIEKSFNKDSKDCSGGIDRLCHNLKVDYDKLPRYLQEEVDKIKSLKK